MVGISVNRFGYGDGNDDHLDTARFPIGKAAVLSGPADRNEILGNAFFEESLSHGIGAEGADTFRLIRITFAPGVADHRDFHFAAETTDGTGAEVDLL